MLAIGSCSSSTHRWRRHSESTIRRKPFASLKTKSVRFRRRKRRQLSIGQMIFEPVYIEPQAMLSAISQEFPNEVGQIRLPKFYLSDADINPATWSPHLRNSSRSPIEFSSSCRKRLKASHGKRSRRKRSLQNSGVLSWVTSTSCWPERSYMMKQLSRTSRSTIQHEENLHGVMNCARDELRSLNWDLLHAAYPDAYRLAATDAHPDHALADDSVTTTD